MFCEKCGAQLPDGSQFCEQCGAPATAEAAAVAAASVAQAAAVPAGPSPLKKFFQNKRNVGILAAVLAVIVVAVVVIVIIANQPPKPKTYYLDDYFTVTIDGADGYATAEVSWNWEAMYELSGEVFSLDSYDSYEEFLDATDGKFTQYTLDEYFSISPSATEGIHNGDEIVLSLVPEISTLGDGSEFTIEALEKEFNVKLKIKNDTITVADLRPVVAFDPFEHLSFTFTGVDGYGEMEIVTPNERITVDETYSFALDDHWGSFTLELYENDSYIIGISYEWSTDVDGELKNGDTFTVTVSEYFDADDELRFASYGFTLASTEKTYTVSGLTPVTEYSPAENLAPVFSGYNGYGTMALGFASEELTVSGCDVKLLFTDSSSSWTKRFQIAILNEEGEAVDSLTYSADTYENLKNDDTVTFETSAYMVGSILSQYGISLPETFTITVADLVDPLIPGVLDNAAVSFRGFNKYGVMEFSFPEEADKQTFTLGDYTFKLTPSSSEGWSGPVYKITVVVANAQGENIISLYYSCDDTYNLENGETVAFESSIWSSKRTEYLNTYGIYFPESFSYTVEDLPEATETDPRQYATYSFSEVDGDIRLTLGLTQTSYTLNGYTINLSVAAGQGYSWSLESRLYFSVVDADGNEIATGYYYMDEDGLSEGDTVTFRSNFYDSSSLAKESGILFVNENKEIIVSTK